MGSPPNVAAIINDPSRAANDNAPAPFIIPSRGVKPGPRGRQSKFCISFLLKRHFLLLAPELFRAFQSTSRGKSGLIRLHSVIGIGKFSNINIKIEFVSKRKSVPPTYRCVFMYPIASRCHYGWICILHFISLPVINFYEKWPLLPERCQFLEQIASCMIFAPEVFEYADNESGQIQDLFSHGHVSGVAWLLV